MNDPAAPNLRPPDLSRLKGPITVAGFGMTLQRATAPGRHLRARCTRCGDTAPVSAGYWLSRGFGPRPLEALQGRLRCVCRSLELTFEVALGEAEDAPRFYVMP